MLLYIHDDEVTGMEKNKEIKKFGDKENVIYETPELKIRKIDTYNNGNIVTGKLTKEEYERKIDF